MKDLIARFSTDMIGITAFGINANSLNNSDAEFRKFGRMIFASKIIRNFEWIAVFFLPNIVRLTGIKTFGKDASNFIRKVFWETITERMKSGEKRNDIIDTLVKLKRNHENEIIGGFSKQKCTNSLICV